MLYRVTCHFYDGRFTTHHSFLFEAADDAFALQQFHEGSKRCDSDEHTLERIDREEVSQTIETFRTFSDDFSDDEFLLEE